MSSTTPEAAASAEFKTKTFFTRVLAFSKFFKIAAFKPRTWLGKGCSFLSSQLMFIAIGICVMYGGTIIYNSFDSDSIPITFFKEYKVDVVGRVQCCTELKCHNVSNIGVEIWDDNIFHQDSFLADTLSDGNGFFNISVKSQQLGRMRPFIQVHHRCNTGFSPQIFKQVYRISWYRIPPKHIVPSDWKNDETYKLYPLSLNGEGFIENRWDTCPFYHCDNDKELNLSETDLQKYQKIVEKYMYYTI